MATEHQPVKNDLEWPKDCKSHDKKKELIKKSKSALNWSLQVVSTSKILHSVLRGEGAPCGQKRAPIWSKKKLPLIHLFIAARLAYGFKRAILANLGHFGALWRPRMAIPDPGKGPNTLSRMYPNLIQPWSTLIHQFGAARPAYGPKRAILAFFGQFFAIKWPKMAGSKRT